jgi:hypothetical protein
MKAVQDLKEELNKDMVSLQKKNTRNSTENLKIRSSLSQIKIKKIKINKYKNIK